MADETVCCGELERLVESDSVPLDYNPQFREWGLLVIQIPPGESVAWRRSGTRQGIRFCPSCGAELPTSLRERFFADMEDLGIEPFIDKSKIPKPYRSDQWWREGDL